MLIIIGVVGQFALSKYCISYGSATFIARFCLYSLFFFLIVSFLPEFLCFLFQSCSLSPQYSQRCKIFGELLHSLDLVNWLIPPACLRLSLSCVSFHWSLVICRMWEFCVGLYMITLWPNSLILPAIYGATESASIALFGPIVGQCAEKLTYVKVCNKLVIYWILF